MTITLFMTILTIGAIVTSLLTEAIKVAYSNAGKKYSSNVIALINALVVGAGGTAIVYMLLGIDWTVNNVICLLLAAVCVWMGSMLGFDKMMQLLTQIKEIEKNTNN